MEGGAYLLTLGVRARDRAGLDGGVKRYSVTSTTIAMPMKVGSCQARQPSEMALDEGCPTLCAERPLLEASSAGVANVRS